MAKASFTAKDSHLLPPTKTNVAKFERCRPSVRILPESCDGTRLKNLGTALVTVRGLIATAALSKVLRNQIWLDSNRSPIHRNIQGLIAPEKNARAAQMFSQIHNTAKKSCFDAILFAGPIKK